MQDELAEILMFALSQISTEQRSVVIMKEYEGLKFHEIAEILEVSENTIKSRMYYGLGALKKILHKNHEMENVNMLDTERAQNLITYSKTYPHTK